VGVPDEAMLLAWVEGEVLPPRDELLVANHLCVNPDVARRLEAMRVDREVLQSMEDEGAPADLLQRVGAQVVPLLERRMLLTDAPVVTKKLKLVRAPRPSLVRTLFLESTGRRVMAAAAALLLTGTGVYFAAISLSGSGKGNPGPIVLGNSKDRGSTGGDRADSGSGLASAPKHEDQTAVPILHDEAASSELAMGAGSPDAPWTLAGLVEHERYAREQGIITPSVAIELAQQGNLVVRVRSTDASIDPALLRDLLRGDSSWQVADAQSDDQLLSPEAVAANLGDGLKRGPDGVVSAMQGTASPTSVIMVRARLDTSTFESLCQKLAQARAQVTLERQDRVVVPDRFAIHAGTPRGIPGWSAVPVIVEQAPGGGE